MTCFREATLSDLRYAFSHELARSSPYESSPDRCGVPEGDPNVFGTRPRAAATAGRRPSMIAKGSACASPECRSALEEAYSKDQSAQGSQQPLLSTEVPHACAPPDDVRDSKEVLASGIYAHLSD